VGLYISPASRAYVAKQFVRAIFGTSKEGTVFTLDLGQNLEANAKRALEKVFLSVTPIPTLDAGGGSYSHIVQVEIDERTSFDIGKFAFSQKTVRLFLQCRLFNRQGSVLWEETFDSEASRSNVKGFLAGGGVLVGGIWGTYARQAGLYKLQEAAEENCWANLEMLNTRMVENRALFQ